MSGKPSQDVHNRHHDLTAVYDSMLDGLGQLSAYFGFSKAMGQLYAALLLSPEPLSLDDLAACLGLSKASVSINARMLEHLGMVRQAWLRGQTGRRKYYEAKTDFSQIITNLFSGREMRDVDQALTVMDQNTSLLSEILPTLDEADAVQAQLYLERITQIQALFRFAHLVITSILGRVSEMNLDDISRIDIQ